MLNMEQQKDLNGFRDVVKERAARLYPQVDTDTCNDLISMGMAGINAFFKEHPVATAESVMEYLKERERIEIMSEGKHTPTPWKLDPRSLTIYEDNDGRGFDVAYVNERNHGIAESLTNAEFIVTACNSYDQDQETIKALVEACVGLRDELQASGDLMGGDMLVSSHTALSKAEAALALAKKKH